SPNALLVPIFTRTWLATRRHTTALTKIAEHGHEGHVAGPRPRSAAERQRALPTAQRDDACHGPMGAGHRVEIAIAEGRPRLRPDARIRRSPSHPHQRPVSQPRR